MLDGFGKVRHARLRRNVKDEAEHKRLADRPAPSQAIELDQGVSK
ncbi:hypothetical protein [Pseudomonas phoenicis]